jgi:Heavy-metal resistance
MLSKALSPLILVFILSWPALAQDNPPNPPPNDERPNVLSQLALTMDQVQQFKRRNAEHRPQMQAAQQRLREANRDLDMAIYADNVSEEDFQSKLRAFQEAQGEVTRLRFQNELSIRKILTPDQLTRFREIRRRFTDARDFIQERRQQRRQQIQDGIKRRNQKDQQKPPPPNPLKQNRRGE